MSQRPSTGPVHHSRSLSSTSKRLLDSAGITEDSSGPSERSSKRLNAYDNGLWDDGSSRGSFTQATTLDDHHSELQQCPPSSFTAIAQAKGFEKQLSMCDIMASTDRQTEYCAAPAAYFGLQRTGSDVVSTNWFLQRQDHLSYRSSVPIPSIGTQSSIVHQAPVFSHDPIPGTPPHSNAGDTLESSAVDFSHNGSPKLCHHDHSDLRGFGDVLQISPAAGVDSSQFADFSDLLIDPGLGLDLTVDISGGTVSPSASTVTYLEPLALNGNAKEFPPMTLQCDTEGRHDCRFRRVIPKILHTNGNTDQKWWSVIESSMDSQRPQAKKPLDDVLRTLLESRTDERWANSSAAVADLPIDLRAAGDIDLALAIWSHHKLGRRRLGLGVVRSDGSARLMTHITSQSRAKIVWIYQDDSDDLVAPRFFGLRLDPELDQPEEPTPPPARTDQSPKCNCQLALQKAHDAHLDLTDLEGVNPGSLSPILRPVFSPGTRMYWCEPCNKKWKDKKDWRRHMWGKEHSTTTGRIFLCSWCSFPVQARVDNFFPPSTTTRKSKTEKKVQKRHMESKHPEVVTSWCKHKISAWCLANIELARFVDKHEVLIHLVAFEQAWQYHLNTGRPVPRPWLWAGMGFGQDAFMALP